MLMSFILPTFFALSLEFALNNSSQCLDQKRIEERTVELLENKNLDSAYKVEINLLDSSDREVTSMQSNQLYTLTMQVENLKDTQTILQRSFQLTKNECNESNQITAYILALYIDRRIIESNETENTLDDQEYTLEENDTPKDIETEDIDFPFSQNIDTPQKNLSFQNFKANWRAGLGVTFFPEFESAAARFGTLLSVHPSWQIELAFETRLLFRKDLADSTLFRIDPRVDVGLNYQISIQKLTLAPEIHTLFGYALPFLSPFQSDFFKAQPLIDTRAGFLLNTAYHIAFRLGVEIPILRYRYQIENDESIVSYQNISTYFFLEYLF
jgi:hypothetical protein